MVKELYKIVILLGTILQLHIGLNVAFSLLPLLLLTTTTTTIN
jgi:hypothetical protein